MIYSFSCRLSFSSVLWLSCVLFAMQNKLQLIKYILMNYKSSYSSHVSEHLPQLKYPAGLLCFSPPVRCSIHCCFSRTSVRRLRGTKPTLFITHLFTLALCYFIPSDARCSVFGLCERVLLFMLLEEWVDGVNESLWDSIILTSKPKQWAESSLKPRRAAELDADSQWDLQDSQFTVLEVI